MKNNFSTVGRALFYPPYQAGALREHLLSRGDKILFCLLKMRTLGLGSLLPPPKTGIQAELNINNFPTVTPEMAIKTVENSCGGSHQVDYHGDKYTSQLVELVSKTYNTISYCPLPSV